MVVGTTQKFTAVGTYSTERTQDLTEESAWKSLNTSFLSMDGNIAAAVKATPVSYIVASLEGIVSPETGAKVATFDVILRLEMIPDITDLFTGQSQQFQVMAYYAGSPDVSQNITDKVTWSSSDREVLSPDGGNNKDPGVYSGVMPGTAILTASYENSVNDTIEVTKSITVLQVFLDRIEISPSNATVAVGNTRNYNVSANLYGWF